jgi:hypothetical protein
MTLESIIELDELADAWTLAALPVDTPVAVALFEARAAIDRVQAVAAEAAATLDRDRQERRLRFHVEDVLVLAADAAPNETKKRIRHVTAAALRAQVREIAARLAGQSDTVVAILRASVEAAAKDATLSARLVDGLHTDAEAMNAGPKQREAWAKLVASLSVIEAVWHVASRLRYHGLLPGMGGVSEVEWRWRNPDAVPARRSRPGGPERHPVDWFAEALRADAGPTVRDVRDLEQAKRRPAPSAA